MVYAQRGTVFTSDDGLPITSAGRVVPLTPFILHQLQLGPIRTDDPNAYPVIDQQVIGLVASSSITGPSFVAALNVGINITGASSITGPALVGTFAITDDVGDGQLVDAMGSYIIDAAGNYVFAA